MSTYTRKTFIAVADILSQFSDVIHEIAFEDLVNEFGDLFSADNSNFDFEKFREACNK